MQHHRVEHRKQIEVYHAKVRAFRLDIILAHVNAKLSGQVKKGVTNFRDMPQGYSMKSYTFARISPRLSAMAMASERPFASSFSRIDLT
jgi:hypothetical protein